MNTASAVRVAVDIGGTFTDLHLHDPATGITLAWKTPSTPQDPSIGLIRGLTEICEIAKIPVGKIGLILHGSTIATNAVLERKLPKGALITTTGFRDVLEIGRHIRHEVYSLKAEPRSLLIPRSLRYEVPERILADGQIQTALDETALLRIVDELVEQDVQTVAITFLHGYRNPVHELRAAQLINQHAPNMSVATSFHTSPEIREFERVSTTVLNALLRPVISGYLKQVTSRLEQEGITAALYLVQSNGGLATPDDAAQLPAKLLLSGPAGGAMAMASLAARHQIDNLVGFDMGGTSSDISVVRDGEIGETAQAEIDGLPVRLPMVEVRTIGAGGGSIARVESGALRVGPQSAGAQPGPACYGRGGTAPTVTDANAVLGRIDAKAFRTGGMALDLSASDNAIDNDVAGALSLTRETAASGVLDVATAHMAGAIRLSLFEKGADPIDFSLAPFGGAAGLHACAVARDLGMNRIVFPAEASTLSALGILNADLRYDLSDSQLLQTDPESLPALVDSVTRLRVDAAKRLAESGMSPAQQRIEISCDVRYRGQAFELNTGWPELGDTGLPNETTLGQLVTSFHQLHERQFTYSTPEDAVEIVTVRAVAIGVLDKPDSKHNTAAPVAQLEPKSRELVLDGKKQSVPVIGRNAIRVGDNAMPGPLIVEEDYTVLLIEAGWQISALDGGDLKCERRA
jgi:N-methylhydantoinase A